MIKCALVGYGYWGPNVAKQMHANPDVDLYAICDKRSERLEAAKKVFVQQTRYLDDYSAILDDPQIKAVALAVETSAHFQMVKQALVAGKHVYVEKPFTANVADACELRDFANQCGLVIHVDHIMMYHPVVKQIKSRYDAGEFGEMLYFDASRMNLGQVKSDVNAMFDLAIHDLSVLDYIANPGIPDQIHVVGHKSINYSEVTTFLLLKYPIGLIANIKSNWLSPIKERKMILTGTKKMVVYDDVRIDEQLKIFDSGLTSINIGLDYDSYVVKTRTGDILSPNLIAGDALYNSFSHFIKCIENGTQSLSSPDQAIRLLVTLEKANELLKQ